ncbi:hypothetical protein JCM11641_004807 [Rhodosporidiobolus odoratus]
MEVKTGTSPTFDCGRWSMVLHLDKDKPDQLGLFLEAHPLTAEGSQSGSWKRNVAVKFSFEILEAMRAVHVESREAERADWDKSNPDWGFQSFATRDAVFFSHSIVQAADTFTVLCTLTTPHNFYALADREADELRTLRPITEALFEDSAFDDVRFLLFKGHSEDPSAKLFANKAVLKARSSYFRDLFESGAGHTVEISSASSTSSTLSFVSSSPAWEADDDSLEWLPEEWLEEHGPKKIWLNDEERSGYGSDDDDNDAVSEGDNMLTIKVKIAGYTSYRALLYYLYTYKINFTPPASDFTVEIAKTGNEAPSSRREWLLRQGDQAKDSVDPASPREMYRLADKLDLEELKNLAKEAIVKGFKVANILDELISTFACHFEEIQTAALDFTLENWSEVKTTPAFDRVIDGLCSGQVKIEGAGEVWKKLLRRL